MMPFAPPREPHDPTSLAPPREPSDPTSLEVRLVVMEGHYETLNREMGEVVGELRSIKWFVGGTMLAASAGLVKLLIG